MAFFRTFFSDRKGSVTYIFAFSSLPLLGCAGVAIDYARAVKVQSIVQSAVDSTTLMAAREASKMDAAALSALTTPYFRALMSQHKDFVAADPAVTKSDKSVTLSTAGTVKTHFAGLFGWPEWAVAAASQANFNTRKIELAMVLDNTGSMGSKGKLGELKKASHALLNTLEASAVKPDQIKVALVPYTTRVNLGTADKNAVWLTNTPTGTMTHSYKVPANRLDWEGCIADRDTGYNNSTLAVGVLEKSKYPMVDCHGNLAKVMPLTSNWTQLHARVDEMKAAGNTNITIGAQWGYEMLSGAAPFAEASADPTVERFMILLTDGENTQDRFGNNNAKMNTDTRAMCDAITERGVAEAAKKHNIKLYTVLVIDGNEPLLKNCATSPSMFKNVKNASELEQVFKEIAEDIGQIRLTM